MDTRNACLHEIWQGILLLVVMILAVPLPLHGAQADDRRELIEAAFIYNFARFTEWPTSSFDGQTTEIRVCVAPEHRLAGAMTSIDGKTIGQRVISVVAAPAQPNAVDRCHIAVLTPSELDAVKNKTQGVLIIGDTPDFAQQGGAVELIRVGRQVRFTINTTAIESAELRMSSRLLRLASRVVR